MQHASLFSGIGGFDLAAEWMGWPTVMQCEIAPFCQTVLQHYSPSSTLYGDIRTLDGSAWRGRVDVLTGGFPCQPVSAIGRRRGTADDRFLWPEMLRVIREVQPSWVVAENVLGITSIDGGMVFERVCTDLEDAGYDVQPLLIPACAVGAPHRRYRVWFVARHAHHAVSPRLERHSRDEQEPGRTGGREDRPAPPPAWASPWPDAATRLCRVDDGVPRGLDGQPVPGWRKESLTAYGNAIVPQIAYRIFQAISHAESSVSA